MYGHTFAQALSKLGGDELRVVYVLCCDTALQELLVSKIRDWIKREPDRFARKLEEKVRSYRDLSDDELRLGILLELAKRAKLTGAPLTTAAELEQFAGAIVEQVEVDVAEEDRMYVSYREDHPEASELEALIDYQIIQLMQVLGRLLDTASQEDWDVYMRRIDTFLPNLSELREAAQPEVAVHTPASTSSPTDLEPEFSEPPAGSEDFKWEGTHPQGIAESPEVANRDFNIPPLDLLDDPPIGSVRLDKEPLSTPERSPNTNSDPLYVDRLHADLIDSDFLHSEPRDSEPFTHAETIPSEPAAPPRPNGTKLLLAALEKQHGFAYYETVMRLLASAEGLFGLGETPELYGRRVGFLTVSASPAFLQVLPNGGKNAPLSVYRNLNPQRRRLPLLLTQLFLPELVSEDELTADYEPMMALWRSYAESHAALHAELAEEATQIDYYTRESASCAEQLERTRTDRAASEQRITEVRSSLVEKLRVSSMQLPHISASFDQLLDEYADNRRRMSDAEMSRQERKQGFAGLVKYTLNYAASSVTLIDLRRKQDRLLERMADEALYSEGEWGQGERYVVSAERERIELLDAEISRLEKLQAEYREELRRAEQSRKALDQDKKKLEKQVYGLVDLEYTAQ